MATHKAAVTVPVKYSFEYEVFDGKSVPKLCDAMFDAYFVRDGKLLREGTPWTICATKGQVVTMVYILGNVRFAAYDTLSKAVNQIENDIRYSKEFA